MLKYDWFLEFERVMPLRVQKYTEEADFVLTPVQIKRRSLHWCPQNCTAQQQCCLLSEAPHGKQTIPYEDGLLNCQEHEVTSARDRRAAAEMIQRNTNISS